jgi:hypothetical protein
MTHGHSAILGTKVGCLWVTLFGSSRCSVGFTDTLIGFGHSRVTELLYVYNFSDAPKCVTDDPVGTKCSQVPWLLSLYNLVDTPIDSRTFHCSGS